MSTEDKMTFTAEDILRKVRGLLAKAEGGVNEAEAASYVERAHALLAKYNLSLSEVQRSTEEIKVVSYFKKSKGWNRMLRMMCARLCFCDYYYVGVTPNVYHCFVGKEINTTVAMATADYLIEAVERIATKESNAYLGTRSARGKFRRSFLNAAADRLSIRIEARIEELRKSSTTTSSSGGTTNLPALASLYDQERSLVKSFLDEKVKPTEYTSRRKNSSADGANAGWHAGGTISLDPQIQSNGGGTHVEHQKT